MKEIKEYLRTQRELYMLMMLEEYKKEHTNLLDARECLNMVCCIETMLKGIDKQSKRLNNGKK